MLYPEVIVAGKCIECGAIILKKESKSPQVKWRCRDCKYIKYYKPKRRNEHSVINKFGEVIVGRRCLGCGELITHKYRRYCDECVNISNVSYIKRVKKHSKSTPISKELRDKRAKEWLDKNFTKEIAIHKVEKVGTYATHHKFFQIDISKMERKPNGEPDFKKERLAIDGIKSKTYDPIYKAYAPTSGDKIRNRKLKYED